MATAGDDAMAASPGQKEAMEMMLLSPTRSANENISETDASKTDTEIVQMVTRAIDAMIADKPKNNKNYKEFGPQIIEFFRRKGDEYSIETVTAMNGKELGQILSDDIGSKKVKGVATALLKKLNAMKEQLANVQEEEKKEETVSNNETADDEMTKMVIQAIDELKTKKPKFETFRDQIIDYFRKSDIDKEKMMKMSNKDLAGPLADFCGNKAVKGLAGMESQINDLMVKYPR